MEKKQYTVQVSGPTNRKEFIKLIKNNFKLKFLFDEEYMINSKFPFIVDLKDKTFWVCESITCCACAAQNNQILSIEEFKNNMI